MVVNIPTHQGNVNQSHTKPSLHVSVELSSKTQEKTKQINKHKWREGNPSPLLMGM